MTAVDLRRPKLLMMHIIRYEPRWILYLLVVSVLVGALAVVPVQGSLSWVRWLGLAFLVLAALLTLVASRKIGWALSVEGNVLYVQRFNLFSNWQTRRSQELVVPFSEIHEFQTTGGHLTLTYGGRKRTYHFRISSLTNQRKERLNDLIQAVNP